MSLGAGSFIARVTTALAKPHNSTIIPKQITSQCNSSQVLVVKFLLQYNYSTRAARALTHTHTHLHHHHHTATTTIATTKQIIMKR